MRFGRRLRRGFKRAARATGRGLKKGFRAVHSVTHGKNSPILKARNAVAGVLKKVPVVGTFVEIGEKANNQIINGLKKSGVLGKKAPNPYAKASATLVAAAASLPGEAGKLGALAAAGAPYAETVLRNAGQLRKKTSAQVKSAAKKATAKLAKMARAGNKHAVKALALASAAHQVSKKQNPAKVRATLAAGGAAKPKGVAYRVTRLSDGKTVEVTL